MRYCLLAVPVLLAACQNATTKQVLQAEVGRSVAHATLVAGPPLAYHDLPDGQRVFEWDRWALVAQGGPRCRYSAYTVLLSQPHSLAAWRIKAIEENCPR